MTKYHVNKEGNAGPCKAIKGACPFGDASKHFNSLKEARDNYEADTNRLIFFLSQLPYERREFFKEGSRGNYTLINASDGYVLSDNCGVLEDPKDDSFYEYPEDSINDYTITPIQEVKDLTGFKKPIVYEYETGAIVSAASLYAVKTSDIIVNFDEIIDDVSLAQKCAEESGFPLWDEALGVK